MSEPIAPPSTQELARPDAVQAMGGAYANLLTIDDSVLTAKGGSYTVYKEVLRDDQAASSFAERRLAVTSKEWQVEPASESALDVQAADFIRDQLQGVEWDRITDRMLYARWYGHAVGECIWGLADGRVVLQDVKVRDRGRFLYDRDGGLYLQTKDGPVPMPERKFWTISTGADTDDSPYGLGLAHFCYWPVFFKRSNIRFWLAFLEKFGQPTAKGTAPAGQLDQPQFREKALAALRAISTDTAVLVPEGMTIEFLEAARSGAPDYETMRSVMDAAVAKIIMGQTASSQGTPGRLGGDDLQGEVRQDLVKADADLVCESFNRSVVRWLTEWNFPGAKPPRVWRVVEPGEDLAARAERDVKIAQLGYEPDEAYITETYGPGWKKKAVQQGVDPAKVTAGLAAEFAELPVLAALKAGHRLDQAAIAEAATHLANRYQDVIGERVEQLVNLAEETGDYDTMRVRLRELLAEAAPPQSQEAIQRAGVVARLMGLFRAQR